MSDLDPGSNARLKRLGADFDGDTITGTRLFIEGDASPNTYELFEASLEALLAAAPTRGMTIYATVQDKRLAENIERFAIDHEVNVSFADQMMFPATHQIVFMDQASIGRYQKSQHPQLVHKPLIVIISPEGNAL